MTADPPLLLMPSAEVFHAFLALRLATVGLTPEAVEPHLEQALAATAKTHACLKAPSHRDASGNPLLGTAHYSQSALFLYRLARAAFLAGDEATADRIYFLNVAQSSCDLYHAVDLPIRTHCDHPLGSVVGRGRFSPSSTFVFADGCGIGNNWGIYPEVDGRLILSSRAAVIGRTTIRGTVVLARGATLIDAGLVEDCAVFGSGRDIVRRPLDEMKATELDPFAADRAS